MRISLTQSILAATLLLAAGPLAKQAYAQSATAGSAVEAAYQAILTSPKVIKTLEDIKADDATAFAEQKRITEIPAPPYKEKVRAEYYLKRFQELGFKDADGNPSDCDADPFGSSVGIGTTTSIGCEAGRTSAA